MAVTASNNDVNISHAINSDSQDLSQKVPYLDEKIVIRAASLSPGLELIVKHADMAPKGKKDHNSKQRNVDEEVEEPLQAVVYTCILWML